MCSEVLRFTARSPDCVVAYGVPVPLDYIPNIYTCAHISNDFFYVTFQRDIDLFDFFGSGRIYFALCESWASFVVIHTF